MRLMIALVTLCMLCGAFAAHSLAGQAEIDRAKRELDAARQAYANSDAQTRQAEQHVNDVRANIDNARAKQRELPRQIDSDKAALDNLKTQIDDAQKTTDQAQQAAADTKKKADDRRAGLKGLQAAITSANADVDRIRKAETARFEATDDFKTQQIQLDLLQSRYDAAAAKVVEKLSADSAFKAAQADAEAAEALVKKLRESGPADQLPAASQAWIKAKTRVETMKSDAIAADPDARSAKADLKKQQAVVAALRATFEDQLKANPDFAAATQRAGDSVTAVTAANADLRKFDTDLAALNKQIDQKKNLLANGQKLQPNATAQLRRKEQDLRQIETDLTNLDRDLKDANFQADRARADRDAASQRVRNAEDAYRRAGGR